jgi:hypothetical protein
MVIYSAPTVLQHLNEWPLPKTSKSTCGSAIELRSLYYLGKCKTRINHLDWVRIHCKYVLQASILIVWAIKLSCIRDNPPDRQNRPLGELCLLHMFGGCENRFNGWLRAWSISEKYVLWYQIDSSRPGTSYSPVCDNHGDSHYPIRYRRMNEKYAYWERKCCGILKFSYRRSRDCQGTKIGSALPDGTIWAI